MRKEVHYSYNDIHNYCKSIAKQISEKKIYFDCIVGIARGGCIPATILSYMLSIQKIKTVQINSYIDWKKDKIQFSSGCLSLFDEISKYTRILVVDDIVDSGDTLDKFLQLYNFCKEIIDVPKIKTASIIYKSKAKMEPDYWAVAYNTAADNPWVVFPWEYNY